MKLVWEDDYKISGSQMVIGAVNREGLLAIGDLGQLNLPVQMQMKAVIFGNKAQIGSLLKMIFGLLWHAGDLLFQAAASGIAYTACAIALCNSITFTNGYLAFAQISAAGSVIFGTCVGDIYRIAAGLTG